jgi:4-hydroxybenzoate decarboxylase
MPAIHDLRDFLGVLERNGQLLHIPEVVQLEPDIAAAGRAITQLGETMPALSFEKINGYEQARIVTNVHGSWSNHALAMDMPKDSDARAQFFNFVKRYENFPGKVERRTDAPWMENVIDGDINLYDLMPLFRLNRGDGGFYIDKGCTVTRDPDDFGNDNVQNLGLYRLEVKGPNRIGIQPVPEHDIAVHLNHAEARGEDLPVYVAVGVSPLTAIVASMPILYNQSEFEMLGALLGEPCRVVRMPSGHDVPWGAEYVLEGRIISRLREAEGPFGEFTGYYSGARSMPVVEITKVYHRNNPVFEHLYLGQPWTEIDYMIAINTGAPLYVQLKEAFPEIVAVNAMYTHGLVVIISTKCRMGGFARAVGIRCMTTPHGLGYAKIVIVVDETIDPFDLKQVMWALSTKVNPAGDLLVLPHMSILPLDPGAMPMGMTHKLIIDATTPVPPDARGHYGQPLDIPEGTEIWREKLAKLLSGAQS